MFAGARNFAQKVSARFMTEPITIRHKRSYQADPSNPYGDDTLDFEPETTVALGWVVSNLTKSVTEDGALASVAETNNVRFAVGTRVDVGDELTIQGNVWTVVDTSSDDTWPAMLKASIQRQS
ncbi:MAG TPA: hypothetical protein VFP22_02175 [Candidatus Limnocylindrales bacterium]|nr:hypothetical protein [Candidatus Limnocylindrales bacterium]